MKLWLSLRKGLGVVAGGVLSNAIYALLLALLCCWVNYPTSSTFPRRAPIMRQPSVLIVIETPMLGAPAVKRNVEATPDDPITSSPPSSKQAVDAPSPTILDRYALPRPPEQSLPRPAAIHRQESSSSRETIRPDITQTKEHPNQTLLAHDNLIVIAPRLPVRPREPEPITGALPEFTMSTEATIAIESLAPCDDATCIVFRITNVASSPALISRLQVSPAQSDTASAEVDRDVVRNDSTIEINGQVLAGMRQAKLRLLPPFFVDIGSSVTLTLRISHVDVFSPSYFSTLTFLFFFESGSVVFVQSPQSATP